MRTFDDQPAVRRRVPLHLAVTGPQKSGKTWSALELATGEQRVFGGDIYLIDTEAGRGNHYADYFKYRYVPFEPPHGPLDYRAAIDHCVKKGAGVVIIDSMTHEHLAVMEAVEKQLDEWCGSDYKARERNTARAHIKPKAERKALNNAIEAYGSKLAGIFCYRAAEKLKYKTGESPKDLGWQPDTTSTLFYAMTAAFLLPPYSNGVPDLAPENKAERIYVGLPEQFRGWFKPGMRLSPEVGERMARWAMGEAPRIDDQTQGKATPLPDERSALLGRILAILKEDFPGKTEGDKVGRATLLNRALGNSSWSAVEQMPTDALRAGLAKMQPTTPAERQPGED